MASRFPQRDLPDSIRIALGLFPRDPRAIIDDPFRTTGQAGFSSNLPDPREIDAGVIRTLSRFNKERLFHNYLPIEAAQTAKGRALLERLTRLCPTVAAKFELRPNLVDNFTMRVVNGEAAVQTSYIAVSYCWDSRYYSPLPENGRDRRLPMRGAMFQAAILERMAADEGLWCDQLCIDQKNNAEKKISIPAMAALYKNARLVVVCLEDIEISRVEQLCLEAFIKDFEQPSTSTMPSIHVGESPPYMLANPIFKSFFKKLCSAKWFTRAWCSHELRLGQKHIFYIPCATSHSNEQSKLFAFSGIFLWHLVRLASEIPSENPAVGQVKQITQRVFDMQKVFARTRRQLNNEPEVIEANMNYTSEIQEVFKLGCGGDPNMPENIRKSSANCDRVSIVLNTVGNGLRLKADATDADFNRYAIEDECQRQLLLLALADNDPMSLCTLGPPLKPLNITAAGRGNSIFCSPTKYDSGSAPDMKALPALSPGTITIDGSFRTSWIELDGFFLSNEEPPGDLCITAATRMVSHCQRLGLGLAPAGRTITEWGCGPEYQFWRYQTDVLPAWRHRFVLTVACVLHCGLDWMLDVAQTSGFPLSKVAHLKETTAAFCPAGFDVSWVPNSPRWWASTQAGIDVVESVLRFANWLVSWGHTLSVYDGSEIPKDNMLPLIFRNGQCKVLVFCASPKGLFVPTSLARDEYTRLGRVWITKVERYTPWGDEYARWGRVRVSIWQGIAAEHRVLCGKTRVFGSVEGGQGGGTGWDSKEGVRVHSP